ncbi:MAG: hypothetical protein A3I07_03025 [Candidatus Doudnabacteria bacterium RIFCSPLOWO2_02_FULL_42_9]|uniref:8-oxo-dGTP diphosphatase n=1 Tax=Candidatus Doudnabacteria bacterium RIFCSPHIGHO2_01_FULL_41_86 TaxID=1817821 RepID=A0A1F5N7U7_9BACT|nr:MAG: hypothetical protein A2717_03165 [Candidatus Doudnabacteria bacterium RIFCSPHIGHO2_01_FULL_41_86]OGE75703.1 MAG: hypothetical protein A3K07_00525 [Candidatus Doudnabacteria bacterium RIFCSPHIGHO2_01_43_10]OGE85648.1 MAG: hypothetical protein A3E28_02495 [Candidatus Doudnabacteria bacterium RIFCSPHIGHO2_12_FULL_42_22]OGE87144.1 MAG: hypothetical protein A3C49_00130 [Candidatus Doudnabacteria bacterium RIFCSPHIGHO2_02_FULL_42_25]OGE91982.1 MAG: hypothetical protein A2895_00005 [Candidatus
MDGFFVGGFLYNPKTKSVLLQKRDMKAEFNPGLWSFFGGSSENNETPEQCLVRELKEELSIEIDPGKIEPLRSYFNEKFQRQSYIFVIESELKKSEMVLNEGEDFDWIPLTKVLELNLTENTRKSLEVLIERIGQK